MTATRSQRFARSSILWDTITTVSPSSCRWRPCQERISALSGRGLLRARRARAPQAPWRARPQTPRGAVGRPRARGAARGDFLRIKPYGAQGSLDLLGDLLSRKPQVARTEGDVFCHGRREELVFRVLERHADAPAYVVGGALFRNVAPEGDDATACGVQNAVHVLDEGGLARSGVPCNAQELAFAHLEGNVVERPERLGNCPISPV